MNIIVFKGFDSDLERLDNREDFKSIGFYVNTDPSEALNKRNEDQQIEKKYVFVIAHSVKEDVDFKDVGLDLKTKEDFFKINIDFINIDRKNKIIINNRTPNVLYKLNKSQAIDLSIKMKEDFLTFEHSNSVIKLIEDMI